MNFQRFTPYSFLTLLVAVFMSAFTLQAQDYNYGDAWGKAGFTLQKQTRSNVQINYSIDKFSLANTPINDEPMQSIILDGNILPNNEGAPNLPGSSRYVAIPEGAKATLNVLDYRMETIQDVNLAPAPRIPLDTDKSPLHYEKGVIYNENSFYPADPFQLSESTEIRGVDAVMLGITPFQYNPVTKELRVYHDVKVEVDFEGGSGEFGDSRLRNYWWEPIFQDAFINSASLPVIDFNKQRQQAIKSTREAGCEYLIVVPNNPEFTQWADSIKVFRQKQGILTKIVTLDEIGGNTTTILENYFNNAFNTWDIPPAAVLLLADYGTNAANSITSPIWDSYCVSDNIYADVNNNDMPDMVFARITANNAAQLEVMVTKFIHYEKNPPTNPDFYAHPITALGWQTERWFQLCSEVVGGFWRQQGKDPLRVNAIYQGTPGNVWSTTTYGNTTAVVNYFGPSGTDYIPVSPAELGGWSGGTPTMVNNGINAGAFMLQHRDHGFEQGWGEPAYTSSNIDALYNTDLTFVMSINCLTGKYNLGSECFTEKFHRYTKNGENSGALGLIAASEVSYSFVNDAFVWGLFDNMYPEFMPDYGNSIGERGLKPAFANASGKYFLQQSAWPYNTNNKEVTYNLFHHHGGAFLTVYSEVPQNLSVTHNPILISGESSFTVTTEAGAFIALTVEGEIIGTAESTGGATTIEIEPQLPPNTMLVTITKQNYYRYESLVEVIPPSGPYVVFNQFEIDDSQGNGNGMMDYGENIMLDMTIENVGVETASNIVATLNCEDEFVTILNASANFGDINANSTATVTGAFEIEAADNIPDGHNVTFTLSATNGTDTWESFFSIPAHAPMLEVMGITVSDAGGNGNGYLDPGENADIIFETANSGSGDAMDVVANLITMSPFLTINNGTFDLEDLTAGETGMATFNVSVDMTTPIGTVIDLIYTAESGMYAVEQAIGLKVGLIIEDFETGDFGQYEWEFGGNANWTITTSGVYEGTYSAKSGDIGDEQESVLMVTMEVINDDEISFYQNVSSESGYDYLRFYIDGTQKGEWAGSGSWTMQTYPVTAGEHTFKWAFEKDYSVSSGSDCGWIDYITFPAVVNDAMTVYAGQDGETCQGNNYTLGAVGMNFETLEWSTSGTGTFDDNTLLDATYFPSDDDYSNGMVTLTITIYGDGGTMADNLDLSFMPNPGQCNIPTGDAELCLNPGMVVYETEEMENVSDYSWMIEPEEAGTISYNMNIAEITWSETFTGTAQIMVMGMNECGEGEVSGPLDITVISAPAAASIPTGDTDICEGTTSTSYSTTEVMYATDYMWEVLPAEAGTITSTGMEAEVAWDMEWNGEAQIMVKALNDCGEGEMSEPLNISVISAPAAASIPTGDTDLCEGTTSTSYSTTEVMYATDYMWEVFPAEAGTITSTGMEAEVAWDMEWSGEAQVMVKAANDCGEGEMSEALTVVITAMPNMPAIPTGETELCEDNTETQYSTTETNGAEEYVWEIMPAEAGTIMADGITAEVQWAEAYTGAASIHVKAVNTCGESDFSDPVAVNLSPKPAQPETITGLNAACQGVTVTLTVANITNATSCEWMIEPMEAGTIVVNGMNCDVTLSETWQGEATVNTRGINNCGSGDWSNGFTLTVQDCTGIDENESLNLAVYPNPNNGLFTISLEANETINIKLINAIGEVVFSEEGVRVNGSMNKQIETSGLANGVYYLNLIGETVNTIEKIIIRK
ncbi:MAG: T9SS type A sorting domain-containing protein [Bacteroidales bacterium]|nr:T9SS type A sorting domain-containing protein [Bacteroidales bacterium]